MTRPAFGWLVLLAAILVVIACQQLLGCATTRDRPVALHWDDACGRPQYARVWVRSNPLECYVDPLSAIQLPIGCAKQVGNDWVVVMPHGGDLTHELKHVTGMTHPPFLPMIEQWECLP